MPSVLPRATWKCINLISVIIVQFVDIRERKAKSICHFDYVIRTIFGLVTRKGHAST